MNPAPSGPQRLPLSRALAQLEKALLDIHEVPKRQVRILQLLNEFTGSTFSGINLTDAAGRVLGGVAEPLTAERIAQIVATRPTLNALLVASPLYDLMWGVGAGKAFVIPTALFQSSEAYRQVYGPMGMHHTAWYLFRGAKDAERRILVVLSSATAPFAPSAVRALQTICERFAADFLDVTPSGVSYPKFSVRADHGTELDREFRSLAVSAYLQALLTHFYGPLRATDENRWLLPIALIADISRYRQGYLHSVMPAEDGVFYCFTRRKRGRVLCVMVQVDSTDRTRLTCYEDLTQLDRLRKIQTACAKLRRDRYKVFSACLALLDEAGSDEDVLKRAGLTRLKPNYSRQILSQAKRIVNAH